MADRCPTWTIDDAPAAEDVFGSHEPIVDAIRDLIATEPGGRTIGLEGGWGSGKSTVVKLLGDRMASPDSHMVVFDTWAHEGDPLRRSFLEELIRSLTAKSWVDEETWTNRREELAKRRRVETTRPVAKLEKPAIVAGVATAVFAILLPLATALLSAGLTAAPTSAGMVLAGGAIFSLLAVVVVVVGGLSLSGRLGGAGGTWVSLFSVQSVTESNRETIETPDPTSIEFESTFRDLMRDALGTDSGRRLVLVVDNLDRVAPEDARSIWATLQTFLHHPHDARESWLDLLWVVLPYDPTGITRLWNDSNPDLSGKGSDHDFLAGKQPRPLAESFIEKSIQLRFEVPLPLITDWREYLESNLRHALPNHEADFYAAYRLYAHKLAEKGRAPTPRELKQYVNRIGALHRRWQHALPFASLAYHASLNVSGTAVAQRLRAGSLPDRRLAGLLVDGVEGHLAALAFNTDPDHARQLLLGPLIERALTRGTPDELIELLDLPGFWEALFELPFWRSSLRPELFTAARRLLDIPEGRRPDAEWSEVRSLVAERGLFFQDWPALDEDSAKDLSGLLTLVDEASGARIAANATAATIQPEQEAPWTEGTHALLTQFDWLRLRASGSPEAVCNVLARFGALSGMRTLAPRLAIEPTDRAALDQVIVGRIGDEPNSAWRALNVLREVEADLDWDPFVSAAAEQLRSRAASQSRNQNFEVDARHALTLLQIVRLGGAASSGERATLANEGLALEYVALAASEDDDAVLAEWLYEVFRQSPPDQLWTRRNDQPWMAEGDALVTELIHDPQHRAVGPLARVFERRGQLNLIASIGNDSEGSVLASALVAKLWESEDFTAAMTGSRFRALWPHIVRASASDGRNLVEFVGTAGRRPEFAAELASGPFRADRMGMYAEVIRAHPDREAAGRLANWVVNSLTTLARQQWSAAMADSDDWVDLLAAVREVNPDASIGGQFAQALSMFMGQVAEGADVSESVAARWKNTVLPSIAPAIRGAYTEGVVSAAARMSGQLPEAFFELADETLLDPDIFARSQIRDGVLPQLVVEENGPGLSWLVGALREETVRRRVPEDGLSALIEVMPTSLAPTSAVHDQLLEIADLLGLDIEVQELNSPAEDNE